MEIVHCPAGHACMPERGKSVEEKPVDELIDLQPHHLGCTAIAIILPGEGDVGLVEGNEAGVGDRHAPLVLQIHRLLCDCGATARHVIYDGQWRGSDRSPLGLADRH